MVSKRLPASQSYLRAFVELINRFACESFLLCPYCFISETLQNPGSVSFSSRCLIFKVHPPDFLATLLTRRSVLDYNIKSKWACQPISTAFFQFRPKPTFYTHLQAIFPSLLCPFLAESGKSQKTPRVFKQPPYLSGDETTLIFAKIQVILQNNSGRRRVNGLLKIGRASCRERV